MMTSTPEKNVDLIRKLSAQNINKRDEHLTAVLLLVLGTEPHHECSSPSRPTHIAIPVLFLMTLIPKGVFVITTL